MKLTLLPILALALSTAPAFAQKVYIDYDASYDRDAIRTFTWVDTPETSVRNSDPLMHSRIVNAIEHYIAMSGVREVESDPDVFVTYHTSTEEKVSVDTTVYGYGYPGDWAWGGYPGYGYGYGVGVGVGVGVGSGSVSTYETGTLVVDVWDAASQNLVWRGTAAGITVSPNPGKMEKRIDTALKKIVNRWEKIKAKQGK